MSKRVQCHFTQPLSPPRDIEARRELWAWCRRDLTVGGLSQCFFPKDEYFHFIFWCMTRARKWRYTNPLCILRPCSHAPVHDGDQDCVWTDCLQHVLHRNDAFTADRNQRVRGKPLQGAAMAGGAAALV